MNIKVSKVVKILISNIKCLDPVTVYVENYGPGQGMIVIECFGQSWTARWGGMGEQTIELFFLGCDEHYLAKNLSTTKSTVYDLDSIQQQAAENNIDCWRDDPWNDHEFLEEMYGPDMMDWSDRLPVKQNPDYGYLCRIINAVKSAFKENVGPS